MTLQKYVSILTVFLFIQSFCSAQIGTKQLGAIGEEDWSRMWTNYKPNAQNYYPTNISLPNYIDKNTTLQKKNTYLMQGVVYVLNNATLTIEPGTIIKGDYATFGALVITKGSKIIANGLETDPIVFTSNRSQYDRKSGDWGGIILLGNAEVNKVGGMGYIDWGIDTRYGMYGGNDDNDNSGIMKFVRIEFPGNKITKDKEFNGLTLAGVGRNTVIENIQISYSNDDSYEIFGGSVNLKNIISFKCTDDDFDFNLGYNGKIQNAMAIRHPLITDFSGSRCIEADSYSGDKSSMDPNKRQTNCALSNLTLLMLEPPKGQPNMAKEAIYIGKECLVSVTNAIVSGFRFGILAKDENFRNKAFKGDIKIANNLFNRCDKIFSIEANYEEVTNYFTSNNMRNKITDIDLKDLFKDPNNPVFPDYRLQNKDFFTLR
jgi:hypothetical protein